MKTLLLALLTLVSFTTSAQNWQLFPLDSLRAYEIDNDHRLNGIDFRDYKTNNEKTIIDLSAFSTIRKLDLPGGNWSSMHYVTGNSAFGNRIEIANETKLFFVNDSNKHIDSDSLVIKHNSKLNEEWLFYQNSEIIIYARLSNINHESVLGEMDSTKTISLYTVRKDASQDTLLYHIKYGKNFGIFELPKLSSFITFEHSSYFQDILHLESYREMPFYLFYQKYPNTELHYRAHIKPRSGEPASSSRVRIKYKLDGNGKIQSDVYANEFVGNWPTIDTLTYLGWDGLEFPSLSTYYPYYYDTIWVANPIPSKLLNLEGTAHRSGVFKKCEKYVVEISKYNDQLVSSNPNMYPKQHTDDILLWINKDTLQGYNIEGERNKIEAASFLQNIGLFRYSKIYTLESYGSYNSLTHVNSLGCIFGTRLQFLKTQSPLNSSISISPNPASTFINLRGISTHQISSVYATNSLGQSIPLIQNADQIDISTLSSGIYYVTVNTPNQSYSSKLVVE